MLFKKIEKINFQIDKESLLYKIFPEFHIEIFCIMYFMLFFNILVDNDFRLFASYFIGFMFLNGFTITLFWILVIAIFYTIVFTFSKYSPLPQNLPYDKDLKRLTKLIVFWGGLVYFLIGVSSIIYIFEKNLQYNWKFIFFSFFNFVNLGYGLAAIILLLIPLLIELLLIARDLMKLLLTNQKLPFKLYKVMILPLDKKLIDLNTNRIIIVIFILISFGLLFLGKFYLDYSSIINLSFSLFWVDFLLNLYFKITKSRNLSSTVGSANIGESRKT
jgi:hypothetical protein